MAMPARYWSLRTVRVVLSDVQRLVARDVIVAFRQGRVLHFNGAAATVVSPCGGELWMLDVSAGSRVVQDLASSSAQAYVAALGPTQARPHSRVSVADRATAAELQVFWRVPPAAFVEVVPPSTG